jgi:hypothetical protein
VEAMEDDADEIEDYLEEDPKLDFENYIPEEPLARPPKRFFKLKVFSFSFVAFLLVLVGLINLAMIGWFLLHRTP